MGGRSNALYDSRGIAYLANEAYEKALADFSEAISLNNSFGPSYDLRAIAYVFSGNYNAAIADYSKAIELNPDRPENYANRARAYLHIGSTTKARDDLRKARSLDAKNLYSVLWLEIANRKHGSASELGAVRSALATRDWPAPLLDFFLDRITPTELFAAAKNASTQIWRQQLCEAGFYTGAKLLLAGNKGEAEGFFRAARRDCPRNVVEWREATVELRKFGSSR